MPLLGGLFGKGEVEHPNLDHLAQALHDQLGLQLAVPTEDVLAVIDQMIHRELLNFDNAHSVAGMQELFRAKSLRATVEADTNTVILELAPAEELEQEIQAEHAQRPVLHISEHQAKIHITPPSAAAAITSGLGKPAEPARPGAPLPEGFEHLEALEHLCSQIVDMFIKFGRLNTGDKDVLKNIKPSNTSIDARLTALERWQAEVARRARALSVPKMTQHLTLGGVTTQEKPEETLRHRFDALLQWFGKLIKVFEHTGGVKFHDKPMWLQH